MITEIKELSELKKLYDNSAMTWEGLNPDDFEIALKTCGKDGANGYIIKGKTMNELCSLTGLNAYPDDLNIFAIYPYQGLAMMYGARWMDDIIDNNADREDYHPFSSEGGIA